MNKENTAGASLVELLTCVSILGVLAYAGSASLDALYRRTQLTNTSQDLHHLTQLARQSALTRQTRISLCPLNPAGECSSDWQQSLSIFTDNNGNRRLDQDDEILKTYQNHTRTQITWRGMGTQNSLHFNRQGITFVSNGTFYLQNGNLTAQLAISRLGKAKIVASANRPPPE
ncbi:GspH/FimT family pseudopilin [Pseudomonas borbori]